MNQERQKVRGGTEENRQFVLLIIDIDVVRN